MDPRLKLQYYKDNNWEESFIQNAKKQITDLWNSTYKTNTFTSEEFAENNNDDDDLFSHIFKKQKTGEKDELSNYFNEGVVTNKTDILLWWKVYLNLNIIY
jgi:hypothetical protein